MKKLFLLPSLSLILLSSLWGQGNNAVNGFLQNAAVANGSGTPLNVAGMGQALVTVNCTVTCSGGTTVNFMISQDGVNYSSQFGQQVGSNAAPTLVVTNQSTTPTLWKVDVTGATYLEATISAYSAGTITVTAQAITLAGPLGNYIYSGTGAISAALVGSAQVAFAGSGLQSAAVTTATTVKSTTGNLYGIVAYNPNATSCIVQVFNTTTPTLGTTVELLDLPVNGTSGSSTMLTIPLNFTVAISVAATTAAHGASTCATGMPIFVLYK